MTMLDRCALGPKLKERRERLGLSLRDVEEITEGRISNAYLSQLETGKIKSPSLAMAVALTAVYALPAETVFEWAQSEADPIKATPICPTCGRAMIDEKRT